MRPTTISCSILALLSTGTFALPQLTARSTNGIIGVFDDASCTTGQKDLSNDRTCSKLPGQSMKIWWLEKGCGVVTIRNRECKGSDTQIHYTWNECISTKDLYSWSIYCDP